MKDATILSNFLFQRVWANKAAKGTITCNIYEHCRTPVEALKQPKEPMKNASITLKVFLHDENDVVRSHNQKQINKNFQKKNYALVLFSV